MKTLTKKKHFLLLGAGMLSLAVAGSVGAITASAEEKTLSKGSDTTGTTTVSTIVDSKWTATFDDQITLNKQDGTGTITFTFSDVKVDAEKHLSAKVKSANNWKLKSGEAEINYTFKKGTTDLTEGDGTFLDNIDGNSEELSAQLSIDADVENAKSSGTYTDTLTFEVTEA